MTLLMVAGEASGDSHGASLITALKQQNPTVRIIGVGGPRMAAAGQEQLFDLAAHAVIGLTAVLRHYFKFRRFFYQVLDLAKQEKPDAVILIDYPGFNLRLAAKVRHCLPRTRVIYYIAPQVWAWKPGRIYAMQRNIDLLLTIFPFEVDWFAQRVPKFKVQWVGHPLLDRIHNLPAVEIEPNTIALLPGSRETEIKHNLPILWEAARRMVAQKNDLHFLLLSPNEEMRRFAQGIIAPLGTPNFSVKTIIGTTLEQLSRCKLALVASGTATLECALVGVLPIVVYRVNPITYAIGKRLVQVKHLSIVNVMVNREVVPELLQDRFTPETVAQQALALLNDPARSAKIKAEVAKIIATLGGTGASDRAAAAILAEVALPKT